MMSKAEGIILVQAGGSVNPETTKAQKKELFTPVDQSSPLCPPGPGSCPPKGPATLENFPALSNGVGVSFPLGPLRHITRKLPQILEQAVIPLFSYEILRRDGSQQF